MNPPDIGDNFHRGRIGKDPPRYGARRDPADRFPGARASAAAMIAVAVLRLVGVISVRWAVNVLEMVVGLRPGILVAHHEKNRRARREPLENA